MDFALTYQGRLPTKKDGGALAKHAIRLELHKQVRALCQSGVLAESTRERLANPTNPRSDVESRRGHLFVPLVRKGMPASLDILMLRGDDTTSVVIEGDIDNRLKTLFDALADDQLINQVSVGPPRVGSTLHRLCPSLHQGSVSSGVRFMFDTTATATAAVCRNVTRWPRLVP